MSTSNDPPATPQPEQQQPQPGVRPVLVTFAIPVYITIELHGPIPVNGVNINGNSSNPVTGATPTTTQTTNITHEEYQQLLNQLFQQNQPLGPPPTSKEFLANLPKRPAPLEFTQETCAVCQDNYKEGEETAELPCKHAFHTECILPWLNERNTCPTCRYQLPEDKAAMEKRIQEQQAALRETEERIRQYHEQVNAQQQEALRLLVLAYLRQQQELAARRQAELRRREMEERERRLQAAREREAEVYRLRNQRIEQELNVANSAQTHYEEDGIRVHPASCDFEPIYGPCDVSQEQEPQLTSNAFTTLTCGHSFHTECLEQSLRVSNQSNSSIVKCPICLKSVTRITTQRQLSESDPRSIEVKDVIMADESNDSTTHDIEMDLSAS